MGIGVLAHLAYGAGAGAVLATLVQPVNVAEGLGFGVLLWIVMGLVFLPYLGWGLIGTGQNVKIAGATLFLHLVGGATMGLTLHRPVPLERVGPFRRRMGDHADIFPTESGLPHKPV